jgi:hypothetical protein
MITLIFNLKQLLLSQKVKKVIFATTAVVLNRKSEKS